MIKSRATGLGLKIMYLTDDDKTLSRVELLLTCNNVDVLCCCDDEIDNVVDFALNNINDCDGLILDLLWKFRKEEPYLGLTYLYPRILPAKPEKTITAILTRFASTVEPDLKALFREYNIPRSLVGDSLSEPQIRTVIGNLLRRLGVQDVEFPGRRL